MTHKFKTHLTWHDSTGGECDCEVTVEYDRHAGFKGDMTDPPEPASVEIVSVKDQYGDSVPDRFMSDDDLLAECIEHWSDDDAAAAEYRAEQRADNLMRERWA